MKNTYRKELKMPQFIYNGEVFEYKIIKKKKKTITIKITREGEVVVTSPIYVDDRYILNLVEGKAEWIVQKLKEIERIKKDTGSIEYKNGSRIEYLGTKLILCISEDNVDKLKIYKEEDKLYIKLPKAKESFFTEEMLKKEIIKWLKEESKVVLKQRVEFFSQKYNLVPNRVVIKEQKTIWGSCSSKGNINLNWRLILVPLDVLDYVVVHELCHLKHHNHSKKFWDLVKEIMPDFEKKKMWLKENGGRLFSY
ncbi:M48 family metallopeptidase [Caloramator sp. ALD01]|uniref:M48 family metallopeptidase n=1 Tax=Caloramator sp. ALD01 TaxID=1031288 RepID=UPI000406CF06|nr:SprT family zinc-dependent metalloprotease [Caloramator sp. ALD01]